MRQQSPNISLAELNTILGEVLYVNNMEKKELTADDKLNLLLDRFAKFDEKLTTIGTRIDSIEGTLGDHSQSIERIDGNLVADSNRLAAVETLSSEHRKEINELKESTKFLSDEYEKMKLQIADLETSTKENVHLKKRVDDLENDLLQEKIGRNDEQQYLRQAFNVKVCGIPIQVGEDVQLKTASNPVTLEVLKQFALQTDILLPPSDIDVCHRLGSDADAPIIIRFDSKSARYKFVAQKEKLKNVTSANIVHQTFRKFLTNGRRKVDLILKHLVMVITMSLVVMGKLARRQLSACRIISRQGIRNC